MKQDRMTVAREALTEAAKAFREYEAHHMAKMDEPGRVAKAHRNRELAVKCEMAVNLLVAQ